MIKSLDELHADFLDYSEFTRHVSRATLRAYKTSFALLRKRYPGLTLEMIDAGTLNEFFKFLQIRPRVVGRGAIKTGVKRSTIASHWRKLSKFFGWLKAKGLLRQNPLRGGEMEFPTVHYEDKKYLNRSQVEKILVAIAFNIRWSNNLLKARNLALVSIALNCGLRRGELLGLKLSDLDLARNEIMVRSETSKSQGSRTIPLNSRVRRDLEDYLQARRERSYTSEYLWVSDGGDYRLTGDGLKHVTALIANESGVKFHLHQLRHTFAVNFLHNSGQNSWKLQRLLGHKSIISTAVYTRCLPTEAVRGDLERIGSLDNIL
jgi:site-specific recombinase XerD